MFGIIQKKGNPEKLSGRVIAYVKISNFVPNSGQDETPFDALISSDGILSIQGDYSKTPDFESFKSNLPDSLPKGLQDLLKHILDDDDIRETFDTSKIKKINVSIFPKNGQSLGEFFPVPAQLTPYSSEEVLLNEDADIYFLGEFNSIGNAHLFLMGFPIIYQSKYREMSEKDRFEAVDNLLEEIGDSSAAEDGLTVLKLTGDVNDYKDNIQDLFINKIMPTLIYTATGNNETDFKQSIANFRRFMRSYPHAQDIDTIENILCHIKNGNRSPEQVDKLELFVKKISALCNEQYELLQDIQAQIDSIT